MDAFIIDGVYTPRASVKKGASAYCAIHPQNLLKACFDTLKERQGPLVDRSETVLVGCVSQVGEQGANLARNALLAAGLPQATSAASLNMCCGSGLEAVNLAAASVASGANNLALAGGVESMSRVKMASDGGGMDGNNLDLRRRILQVPQGISADWIAALEKISRDELEQYALISHQRASAARAAGYFDRSYALVAGADGQPLLHHEDHIRPDASLSALAALPPAFAKMAADLEGAGLIGAGKAIPCNPPVHTAGTASGIADGAAALLIANEYFISSANLKARAKILAVASRGSDPLTMLTGPADCSLAALKACGMTVQDIDLWEVNEAFAVVPIQTMRRLNISWDKVNVWGGAIALGHPLGATGAILITSLLAALEQKNLAVGCVVLCVAGGQSVATVIERC